MMIQTLTTAYYTIPAGAARLLAAEDGVGQSGTGGSGGSSGGSGTSGEFNDILNNDAFKLPLVFFKILAVLFFFWMIFKIVEAVAQSKWPRAVGLLVAGALVVFMAWNPAAVFLLLDLIGNIFKGVIELLDSMVSGP